MKYNKNSNYNDDYYTLNLNDLKKGDLKLDGLGGENSVLIYDALNSVFGFALNALNKKSDNKYDVPSIIREPLNKLLPE